MGFDLSVWSLTCAAFFSLNKEPESVSVCLIHRVSMWHQVSRWHEMSSPLIMTMSPSAIPTAISVWSPNSVDVRVDPSTTRSTTGIWFTYDCECCDRYGCVDLDMSHEQGLVIVHLHIINVCHINLNVDRIDMMRRWMTCRHASGRDVGRIEWCNALGISSITVSPCRGSRSSRMVRSSPRRHRLWLRSLMIWVVDSEWLSSHNLGKR